MADNVEVGAISPPSRAKRHSRSISPARTLSFVQLSILWIPHQLSFGLGLDPPNPIAPPIECSSELDLHCPSDMKCCPTASGFACLGSSEASIPLGSCCEDVDSTGCPIGYACAAAESPSSEDGDELARAPHCRKQDDSLSPPLDTDGVPIRLEFDRAPRYHLCPSMGHEIFAHPHGLKIPHNGGDGYIGQLAYFSNMGPIDSIDQRQHDSASDEKVTTAIVAIHGAHRVAANYMCSMIRAVMDWASANVTESERVSIQDQYLVVAPWFMAPVDGELESNSLPFLYWDDVHPIEFSFRYGAESIPNANYNDEDTISSFGAMDVLLETLCQTARFENLQHIVIVGHSAGGQFVHRWALSSNHPCLDRPLVRLVVANPRSFTYLDDRRYLPLLDLHSIEDNIDHLAAQSKVLSDSDNTVQSLLEFRAPTSQEEGQCPIYDNYIMGLRENPHIPAPYFQSNTGKLEDTDLDNTNRLFCRYASRRIIYLSGRRDTDVLTSHHCNDVGYFQGMTRRERSRRFYSSLQVLGEENQCAGDSGSSVMDSLSLARQIHRRMEVNNVGHDHALVFVSSEGQNAIFHDDITGDEPFLHFSGNVIRVQTNSVLIHDYHGQNGGFLFALLFSLCSFLLGLWVRSMFSSWRIPKCSDPCSIDPLFLPTETTPLQHPRGQSV
ncbi:hypothetical protein HJC23_007120 [Cyclotella cryptica]|uniref:WAP domain-containing protein n=1 Tax=Cyclotella cryptica TaxID=29204 RepID=A0ABD3NYB8_9STRA|eukprot:CCRYP_018905-RA/>CCRYP_018905-RA protein AED:0.00 eAED:0.00 QI:96/-1/1/1/-1/1/1/309/666